METFIKAKDVDGANLNTEAGRALVRISKDEQVITKAIQSLKQTFASVPDYLLSDIDEKFPESKRDLIKLIMST